MLEEVKEELISFVERAYQELSEDAGDDRTFYEYLLDKLKK